MNERNLLSQKVGVMTKKKLTRKEVKKNKANHSPPTPPFPPSKKNINEPGYDLFTISPSSYNSTPSPTGSLAENFANLSSNSDNMDKLDLGEPSAKQLKLICDELRTTIEDVKRDSENSKAATIKILRAHEIRLNEHDNKFNEADRQMLKFNVIMSGRDLPPRRDKEDCMKIFTDICQNKWSIRIEPKDIDDVHRKANGQLLATFKSRAPKSSYDRLIHRFKNWHGKTDKQKEMKIWVEVQLCPHDQYIQRALSALKANGKITSFYIGLAGCLVMKVREKDKYMPIRSFEQIRHLCDEQDYKRMIDSDKTGKSASNFKRKLRSWRKSAPNLAYREFDQEEITELLFPARLMAEEEME